MLRLYDRLGCEFESRGGIITLYIFLFTSFSKSFFTVLFATYSVNVNFRDFIYYIDHMNPLFSCDHGAATHSCIMHDTGRGTLCKNASGLWSTTHCPLNCKEQQTRTDFSPSSLQLVPKIILNNRFDALFTHSQPFNEMFIVSSKLL